ncbi:uncharacterized protein LOC127291235 isoform X2 [Leptopilina boulardi]|uniref:uncharacterized protein LOC127291235 isoform X2 n=1 Tax=Leptopilina boulardi TaxID=63433 RepID=UPI0021F59A55|nr:uncharacterized protein LOC127291235 isoform X2 [Leptopilina boulardi]
MEELEKSSSKNSTVTLDIKPTQPSKHQTDDQSGNQHPPAPAIESQFSGTSENEVMPIGKDNTDDNVITDDVDNKKDDNILTDDDVEDSPEIYFDCQGV